MVKSSEKKKTVKDLNIEVENHENKINNIEEILNGIKLLESIDVLEVVDKLKKLEDEFKLSKRVEQLENKLSEAKLEIRQLNEALQEKQNKIEVQPKVKSKCVKCDIELENQTLLKKHISEKHRIMKECDVCNEMFSKNFELEIHLKAHAESKSFKCDQCDKVFSLEWRLNKHKRIHEEIACKFCHYFNNKKYCPYEEVGCMFRHELAPFCKYKVCYNKLCQFQHNEEKGLDCVICNFKPTSRSDLDNHKTKHNNEPEEKSLKSKKK